MELFLKVPGSGLSSPSIQWDGTWLRTDFQSCFTWWCLPSWDKTARWVGPLLLLESKPGQDCSERWSTTRVKEDPEYHRMVHHLIWSMSLPTLMQPSFQLVAQGASQLESRWGLQDVVKV
jgi:hypothetical protein